MRLTVIVLIGLLLLQKEHIVGIATAPAGDVMLVKYASATANPARRYVVRWQEPTGRWIEANLGLIGNEDWEQDVLFRTEKNIFLGIGTQVGYSVPVIIDVASRSVLFLDGDKFSFMVGWTPDEGLASFKESLLFLATIKDRRYVLVAEGEEVKKFPVSDDLEWLGSSDGKIFYRSRSKSGTIFQASSELPVLVSGRTDLRARRVYKL